MVNKKEPGKDSAQPKVKDAFQIEMEARSKREELKQALIEGMLLGKSKNWEGLIQQGLSYPVLMDRLCSSFYSELPSEYKYLLPVKWYMHGGNCSAPVVQAMRKAGQYKPEEWIGKEDRPFDTGIDVFLGSRCSLEEARKEIAWTTSYETAYVQAQRNAGSVYRAFLNVPDIIAINKHSVNSILQYNSVLGVEQIFPKVPYYYC